MVEYLVMLLREDYQVATLSRGYKRKTKGFILAGNEDTAATLGDEPYQFYTKFGNDITVAVGEERAWAIPNILLERPATNVILLDDAFQHRAVRPNVNILVTEYHRPFCSDYVMPSGRLREARSNAKRADAVVITKCPGDLDESKMREIELCLRPYVRPDVAVYFSEISYQRPLPVFGRGGEVANNVLLVSGIANATPLEQYVEKEYNLIDSIRFPDHHMYTRNDLEKILQKFAPIAPGDTSILTTEKDAVKWRSSDFGLDFSEHSIFYLPIEQRFIRNGKAFDDFILSNLR